MAESTYLEADSNPAEAGTEFRWWLRRRWLPGGYTAVIIGTNPSYAAGDKDDQTIRKEVGFCKRNHLNGFVKVNLFPTRATDPQKLLRAEESPGILRLNVETIKAALETQHVSHVICAWGAHSGAVRKLVDARVGALADLGVFTSQMLWSFGCTRDGYPRHTSRLPYDTLLEPWQFVSKPAQFPRPYAEVVQL